MEMNRLTREADELIRKVVARYNSLYSPTGSISQVELDLLLDDLKHMYDKFKLIGQLNLQQQQQEIRKVPAITSSPTAEAPPQPPPAPPTHPEPETEPETKPETNPEKPAENKMTPPKEEKEEEPLVPPQQEFIQTVTEKKKSEEVPALPDAPKTLVDKFKTEQKSLGEAISATDENSVGSKLGQVPVSDLKSVIGLAEKFAFVNELFGGDPLAYEKAIIQLNGATRLNEAEAYLGTLRLNHKWPADSEHAVKLTDIIRRKFAQ